jgi:hypothetical protein
VLVLLAGASPGRELDPDALASAELAPGWFVADSLVGTTTSVRVLTYLPVMTEDGATYVAVGDATDWASAPPWVTAARKRNKTVKRLAPEKRLMSVKTRRYDEHWNVIVRVRAEWHAGALEGKTGEGPELVRKLRSLYRERSAVPGLTFMGESNEKGCVRLHWRADSEQATPQRLVESLSGFVGRTLVRANDGAYVPDPLPET